ncbi:MAG: hypothetical protein AMXMBFR64_16220 [Myxococcales bacterium]
MLWTVIRVEWRNLAGERAVWAVVALFAALVAWAAITGGRDAHARQEAAQAALTEEQDRLARLRAEASAPGQATDPHMVGRELGRRTAILSEGPLASVVGGREPHVVVVSTESRATTSEAELGSPIRQVAGAFDLTFVFVTLLPLVVVALTFDLLAGERERGTLALVLAQPVSLTTFALGKALQRALLLLGVVMAAALAGPALAGGELFADGGLRTTLYAALLVAYTAFWFAAALAVNAWGQSSAGNALALVALWLGLVVVVPGLVAVVVDAVYPPPSRVELVNMARAAAAEAEDEASTIEGDHGAPKGETLGDRYRTTVKRSLAVQEELERRVEPVVAAFREQLDHQQSLVNRLRFLSPAIVLHEGLHDVAGTGVERRSGFHGQVEDFHGAWRAFFHERALSGAPLAPADYDALPAFRHVEEPTGDLTRRVGAGVAGLLVPALALLGAAVLGLRRPEAAGIR